MKKEFEITEVKKFYKKYLHGKDLKLDSDADQECLYLVLSEDVRIRFRWQKKKYFFTSEDLEISLEGLPKNLGENK